MNQRYITSRIKRVTGDHRTKFFVASSILLPLLTWLSVIRFASPAFVSRHPGAVLVFIGVVGEGGEILTKIFWNKWAERRGRLIDVIGGLFWIVLILGLWTEFSEAAKSDKDFAGAMLKVEELRSTNAELAAIIAPRKIEEYTPGVKLQKFAGLDAKIISSADGDCAQLARQIHDILLIAKWHVDDVVLTTKEVENAVSVGICHSNLNMTAEPNIFLVAAGSNLVGALNDGGIETVINPSIMPRTHWRFEGLLILVGNKPTKSQSDFIRKNMRLEQIRRLMHEDFEGFSHNKPLRDEFMRLTDEVSVHHEIFPDGNSVVTNDTNWQGGWNLYRDVRSEPLP